MSSDSVLLLETAALVAPVTALEFLREDFLLTGEGPILSVYDLQPHPKTRASLSVLHNYRIHGIRPRPLTSAPRSSASEQTEQALVVFGGKAVRLVQLRDEDPLRLEALGPLIELQDWALDVRWLSGEGHSLLAVALAHNAALLLDTTERQVLVLCSCLEGCLLYSALLLGNTWGDSVLVGGTVFNQLILWRPGAAKQSREAQVERRLLGHSGVIFSLCYLQEAGWLASASDDRSVRVWGVGRLGAAGGGCGKADPACLRVLYGHQARVFSVRLGPGRVFSAGEDGACLVWDWGGGGRVQLTLKGHRAGGVRALAVSEGCSETRPGGGRGGWVATGGADGGVRLWREEGRSEAEGETLTDLGFVGKGVPKVVCVVGGEGGSQVRVVVGTDQGEVYLHGGGQWGLVWEGGADFQSYCAMDVLSVRAGGSVNWDGLCAVGSLTGAVQVFPLSQPGAGVLMRAGAGKIHSLTWVEGQVRRQEGYLLASGAEGTVYRWRVEAEERDAGLVLKTQALPSFLLPSCAKRWLTAAVLLPRPAGALWVCGDRRGSLLLFKDGARRRREEGEGKGKETEGAPSRAETERDPALDGNRDPSDGGEEGDEVARVRGEGGVEEEAGGEAGGEAALRPACCLFGVHGKQGVTGVREYGGLLYSAGRDGCVRVLRIRPGGGGGGGGGGEEGEAGQGGAPLEVLRVQRACKGMEWLERVLILEAEPFVLHRGVEENVLEEEHSDQNPPQPQEEEGGGEENHRIQEMETGCQLREARFVIVGFHSVHFVVWDPVRQERLLSVPCGGGHRSWALSPPHGGVWWGQAALVFLRQGQVLTSRPPRPTDSPAGSQALREGLHGRGLGCVCRLGGLEGGEEGGHWEVLVSGGEDTSLSVLAVQAQTGTVRVLAVIADHISSVRTLATVRPGDDGRRPRLSTLLVSAGGRAQIQCYRLLIGWDGQLARPSCQVIQVARHRLDEQWERKRNRHKTVKMDPETRYMSAAVVHDGTERVLLALGCSDGAVRVFGVSEVRGQVELLWESFHHRRCVLSVATCSVEDRRGARCVLLFSAATDGRVAVWDLSPAASSLDRYPGEAQPAPTPCFTITAHQSGINALAVWEKPGAEPGAGHQVTVASGGDDGQLTVSVLRVQYRQGATEGGRAPLQIQLQAQCCVPAAHAAPLTALGRLGSGLLVSASPDQRVCLWSCSSTGLCQRGAMFSHVADAAGLEVWQEAGGRQGEAEGPGSGPTLSFGSMEDTGCRSGSSPGGVSGSGDSPGRRRGSRGGEGGRGWVVVCGQGLQLLQIKNRNQDEVKDEDCGKKERVKVSFVTPLRQGQDKPNPD
ncbi:WD repeat-containing protein 6 [Osmerus eperlanus]|uniref:WD repeat-containing protein 6 n=1 Tax=Osmerus eperlanus TaxID=29151 RepID=UPI002E0E37F3